MSVEEFWRLTPREAQLHIRAFVESSTDRQDQRVASAWQGALWSQVGPRNMPKLDRVLSRRRRRRSGRLTVEQEVARWERWAKAGPWKRGEEKPN